MEAVSVNGIRLLCMLLVCSSSLAQEVSPPSDCSSSKTVLQRYKDALGGDTALNRVQTLLIEADASEPHTFNPQETAHLNYNFKWKSPNLIAVKRRYLLDTATVIYDGRAWSDYNGKVSHNEDKTPEWRVKLQSIPYNDYPPFLMFRVLADPLLLARNTDLYSSYEPLPSTPDRCVLGANGKSEWGKKRRDILTFDSKSGLLESWAVQMGLPGEEIHSDFRFDDYRQSGSIKVPFSVYFDFYKTQFKIKKVVTDPRLLDAEFVPKPD